MTDIEPTSVAQTNPSHTKRSRSVHSKLGRFALAVAAVTAIQVAAFASTAGASQLSQDQAKAAQIAAQIQADGQKLDIVSQQYDAAQQQVTQLHQQLGQISTSISHTHQQIKSDGGVLHNEALAIYMGGSTDSGVDALFNASNGQDASATQEYSNLASGSLTNAVDKLHINQAALNAEEAQLNSTVAAAKAAEAQLQSSEQQAQSDQSSEEAALSSVKGQIGVLVQQQQAAEEAAQQKAYQARVAAEAAQAATQKAQQAQQAQTVSLSSSGQSIQASYVSSSLPAAGGASAAVAAAETQLGVPYHWGAESPGVGFDCSGLTQWAWRQAGVSLPRTAAAQYGAIVHVPLSALEPGDLLFWGVGGDIYHVAMYIGGGQVIQAPQTGQDVSIAPIYNNQLVGAGRP